MAHNLRDRLRLIRESRIGPAAIGETQIGPVEIIADPGGTSAGYAEPAQPEMAGPTPAAPRPSSGLGRSTPKPNWPAEPRPPLPGWEPAGFETLKRTVFLDLPFTVPGVLPAPLGIIAPDLLRYAGAVGGTISEPRDLPVSRVLPVPEDLIFFDLETTGLSSGAGTVAFLAAFGRLVREDSAVTAEEPTMKLAAKTAVPYRLRVDQYLLLDYPGEPDFLEAVLGEFRPAAGGTKPPLVVTYNGKSFDSQVLRTRCLMNGFTPPEYAQADLLHPARRLWKRVLPSCSQGGIESAVLSLDRTGDTPGALAPDIWFSFLKTGNPSELIGICDHNVRDIFGLAAILDALTKIAADPADAGEQFRCDQENLALWWRRMVRFYGENACGKGTADTGEALLAAAAGRGYPKAAHVYYRKMAIEAEWREKDPELALKYVDFLLALGEIQVTIREEMFRRRNRLSEKLKQKGKKP